VFFVCFFFGSAFFSSFSPQKHLFGRKPVQSGSTKKKMFCEFLPDGESKKKKKLEFLLLFLSGTLTMTPATGSLASITGATHSFVWNRAWDIKVVDPTKFQLITGDEDWQIKFKSESALEASKWVQTMSAVLARKVALEKERRRVLASVMSSKSLLLQYLPVPKQEMERSLSGRDRKMLDSGLYHYLSETSKTYADDLKNVAEGVRNSTNELFQIISERYLSMDLDSQNAETKQVAVSLISLVEDFLETAQHFGRIIISEVFLPARSKTIKPVSVGGVIGGEKFIVRNVTISFFFRFVFLENNMFLSCAKRCCSSLQSTWVCLKGIILRQPKLRGWSYRVCVRIMQHILLVFISR
jgi:hypothetical protein